MGLGYSIAVSGTPVAPFVAIVSAILAAVVVFSDLRHMRRLVEFESDSRNRLVVGLLAPSGLLLRIAASALAGFAVHQHLPTWIAATVTASAVFLTVEVLVAQQVLRTERTAAEQAVQGDGTRL